MAPLYEGNQSIKVRIAASSLTSDKLHHQWECQETSGADTKVKEGNDETPENPEGFAECLVEYFAVVDVVHTDGADLFEDQQIGHVFDAKFERRQAVEKEKVNVLQTQ